MEKEKTISNAEELLKGTNLTNEEIIISETIIKLDEKITSIAKDSCGYYLKYDWVSKRRYVKELVHIQSTVNKIMQHFIDINNKGTVLYKKSKKLYDRCTELLNVLDPR